MKRRKITKEEIFREAKKYDMKSAFQKADGSLYAKAFREGYLDEACAHMKNNRTVWTEETIHKEALKYKTRKDFEIGSPRPFSSAHKKGIIDKVCSHMVSNRTKWTKEEVLKIALKYKKRIDFVKGDKNAYQFAYTHGFVDEACDHMEYQNRKNGYWTKERIVDVANKYFKRVDFMTDYLGAYKKALSLGILDEVCSHMEESVNGFNAEASAILYYLSINNGEAYKIGITNNTVAQRYSKSDRDKITVIKTWDYPIGKEAFRIEQEILKTHKDMKYTGDNLLFNGNTELFKSDILGLDTN